MYEQFRQSFGGNAGFGSFHDAFSGFQNFSGGAQGRGGIWDDIFGGGSRGFKNSRGDDVATTVSVSFMEACKGTTRHVTVKPVVNCGTCTGTGLKAGAKRTQCPTCHGSGTQVHIMSAGFHMASTCQTCRGTGSTIPRGSHCGTCAGAGKIRQTKTVKVDIPAGRLDSVST